MNKISKKHDSEAEVAAFREAEASLALEGLDPSGPAYNRAKALLIAGEIGTEDAIAMITAEARQRKSVIADVQKTVQNLDATTQQLSKLTSDTDQMMNGDGRRALKNAADATEEAKQTVARANALLAKLEGPTNDLANGGGMSEINSAMVELHSATQSLNRLLNEFQSDPSSALSRPPGQEMKVKP